MTRTYALTAMIGLAALSRLVPHPPNFAPITAMALFGGAYFASPALAFVVPLAAMALSDLAQAHAGLHAGLLDRACAHVDAPSPPSAPAGFGLLRWKLSGSLWHLASLTQPALT